MPRYRILDQKGLNCTIIGWVNVFTRATYGDIIFESLSYCQKANNLEQ